MFHSCDTAQTYVTHETKITQKRYKRGQWQPKKPVGEIREASIFENLIKFQKSWKEGRKEGSKEEVLAGLATDRLRKGGGGGG